MKMTTIMLLAGLIGAADGCVARPQTPVEPFPYATESAHFVSSVDQVQLAGTLTLPKGCQRCPAMILLGVAGPNDRDLSFAGHRAFAVIAHALSLANIAVLRWDDRGVGESQGDWKTSGYDALAIDAVSAFQYLRLHERIDPKRIGYFGLSEGSLIAGMAAAQLGADVRLSVLASPPGIGGTHALRSQFEKLLSMSGVSGDLAQTYRAAYDEFLTLTRRAAADSEQMSSLADFLAGPGKALLPPYHFLPSEPEAQARLFAGPWYQSQLDADPAKHYAQVAAEVLVVSGDKDMILAPDLHLASIAEVLPEAQFRLFENVSHLLQPSQGLGPAEYAQTELTVDPGLLAELVDWISERLH